ncbi:MAG: LysM peptidoglycan-binding domain-containing protein, partial [Neisseriaceae bacterium]|nr:LysM peptidoglycan-binding domain-containing protein [Neisseriaceae bacterium]
MKTNIKTLVISLSLIASANAFAGLGGVNVQSNLGEPFSGSIVVTGKEAETLINNRNVSVSGSGISGTVIPQSNGTAIVRLRSNNIINEPIIHFAVSAGNQQRHYSVAISPTSYANSLKSTTSKNQVQTDEIKGKHSQPTTRSTQTVRGKPNHRVQKEETVSILADRYRPRNMTHAQAVQAIVEANPQIFNARSDGSLLYKGIDIYIPFKSSRYVTGSPTASTKNTVVKYGKPNHYVQEGETVSILADRYRPQNMTHAQAVQAIIAANPRVFKGRADGSLLYKDINIYIPFKSSDADGTPNTSNESSTPTQTSTPSTPAGNTTPATPVQTEPVSTPEPTPAAPKNAETTTPVEQTTPVASEPAPAASEVVASEPQTETAST